MRHCYLSSDEKRSSELRLLRYGYVTVTVRVGVCCYVTLRPPYKGRTYVTPVTSFIGGSELACVDQSLFHSDDCDLACRRLVPFVWPKANFIFDLAVLVPPLDERGSLLWEPRPEMQFGRPIVVFNDIDLGTKCLTNRTVLAK